MRSTGLLLLSRFFPANRRVAASRVLPEYGEKNEDDHVQVIGKVLGIVSDDEVPDKEDTALLRDLLSEELYEFDHKYEG